MEEQNRKHTPEEIAGRMKLMAGIFQKDVQIREVQHEKLEMMQQLYELEMKMYGRMSKIGKEIFSVEHCEIFRGRVREMAESEWQENRDSENVNQQPGKSGTVHGKLNYYKDVEKQQADSRLKEGQRKETPELV